MLLSVQAVSIEMSLGSVLLSKRFDRRGGERVPFSSAMNLLELRDGDASSYADIADLIQHVGEAPQDCEEIFRRMIFNMMINNVDDHLRNHGFLRGKHGWLLSPAYDLNPMSRAEKAPRLATAIFGEESDADIQTAIFAAEFFGLSKTGAREICDQVHDAVAGWRRVADSARAPRREVSDVEDAFFV